MDRYIGMDVHSASCTASVLSAKGKRLGSMVLETNGKSLVEFLRTIPGTRHLIIEEGTHAAWLHEILSPHVHDMVVMGVPKSKGQKRPEEPIFQHYLSLLDNGTNPNLAKLTIARQIASVTLSMWRFGEEYDGKKLNGQ